MENTIIAINNLRHFMKLRNNTIEMKLDLLESALMLCNDEESDEAQDIIHQMSKLEKELHLNRKLLRELSLCDYCKLSDCNLCGDC